MIINRIIFKLFNIYKIVNQLKNLNKDKYVIIISFLFFPLLLLMMFSYYPALKQFELSFLRWDGFSPTREFVGFDNYIDVLKDRETLMTLQNNLVYLAVMLVQTALALYLAIVLDGWIKAKNFFKAVIFLPYILNGIAVAFMFSYMYDFDVSPINEILRSLGFKGIHFLNGNYIDNLALAGIGMWRYTGLSMVIFLGALQSIPKELYEAAAIDGAGYWKMICCITIPNIKRILNVTLLLGINGAMQAYYEAFVITRGGPAGRTHTFITSTLEIAFQFRNYGKASALAVVLLFIILLIVFIQRSFLKESR